jgi:hypothetical protein
MSSTKLSDKKRKELEEVARNWGKLLAREAFPGGPGLDITLADMEDMAAMAARAVVEGAVETTVGDQAEAWGEQANCPTCGRTCKLKRKPRPVTVRGGVCSFDEPVAHCSTCRRDFFPSAARFED